MASTIDPQFLRSYTNANLNNNAFGISFLSNIFNVEGLSQEAALVVLDAVKSAPAALFTDFAASNASYSSYTSAATYQTGFITTKNAAAFACDKVFTDYDSLQKVYAPLYTAVTVHNLLPVFKSTTAGPLDATPALITNFPTTYCTDTDSGSDLAYIPNTALQTALNATFAKVTTAGVSANLDIYNTAWKNICAEFNTGAANALADIQTAIGTITAPATDVDAALQTALLDAAVSTNTVWSSISSLLPVVDGCASGATFKADLGSTITPGTIGEGAGIASVANGISASFKAIPTALSSTNATAFAETYCSDYSELALADLDISDVCSLIVTLS